MRLIYDYNDDQLILLEESSFVQFFIGLPVRVESSSGFLS
jgi:hypothetical protein